MPKLTCTVTDCTHNKQNLCCLSSIKVGCSGSVTTDETECDSFSQKDDVVKKFISAVEQPVDDLSISCSAVDCAYNHDKSCRASDVCICGSECCTCEDTKCDTFRCSDKQK